jgi:cell division protein FtsB
MKTNALHSLTKASIFIGEDKMQKEKGHGIYAIINPIIIAFVCAIPVGGFFIGGLFTDVTRLKQDVSEIKADIKEIKTNVQDVKDHLYKLDGKADLILQKLR